MIGDVDRGDVSQLLRCERNEAQRDEQQAVAAQEFLKQQLREANATTEHMAKTEVSTL